MMSIKSLDILTLMARAQTLKRLKHKCSKG
jgi:hypothetical protein